MENQQSEGNEVEVLEPQPKGKFPDPILSREQWDQIKEACIAGLDLPEASKVFKVSYHALRKRAERENWLTPRKIENLAKAKTVAALSQPVTNGEKPPETALQAVATSLEGYRSRTMLGLAKLAEKGVSEAMAANLTIENWSDAKIVADIACKLHGLGQDGVQVNVLLSGESGFDGPLIETGPVNDDSETDE